MGDTAMTRISRIMSSFLPLILIANPAQADVVDWAVAVSQGSPAAYTSTAILVPSDVDIGVISSTQGLTYEFVINCTNAGASSVLMGSRNTGFGTDSAFKFEQYSNTQSFGITDSGVADYTLASNIVNQDVHVAFVCDFAMGTTELYVNGQLAASANYPVHFTNLVGFGHWFSPGGTADPLTGSIFGAAVYETKLSPAELMEHSTAFANTILGTPFCFGLSCPCGLNDPTGGCTNSTGSGATLEALGTVSVATDDLTLQGSRLHPGSPAVLFAGVNQINNGAGFSFGDGLLCAGAPLQRLGTRIADGSGNATWGPGLLTSASWAASGMTRSLQIWMSDPAGIPCGSNFNTSHGLELTFLP
jgi:hypothetical protein